MQDRENMIIINSFIENDPLSENNLDKTLDLVNEIRLSCPRKTMWLYTGYSWDDIWCNEAALRDDYTLDYCRQVSINYKKRQRIISQCDILVDGRYIESKRDTTLKWRGSSNQRVISVKESLKQDKLVLYNT